MCAVMDMGPILAAPYPVRLERSCALHGDMGTEQVRMWRPADEDRVLLMAGQTTRYAMEPRGEYVVGVVTRQPMRSRRDPERRLVRPGQLVAWDPPEGRSTT